MIKNNMHREGESEYCSGDKNIRRGKQGFLLTVLRRRLVFGVREFGTLRSPRCLASTCGSTIRDNVVCRYQLRGGR